MKDEELRQLTDAVSKLIGPVIRDSPALRDCLTLIGKWLCEQAEDASRHDEVAGAWQTAPDDLTDAPTALQHRADFEDDQQDHIVVCGDTSPEATPPVPRGIRSLPTSSGLVPLEIGDALIHVPVSGTTAEIGRARLSAWSAPPPADLQGSSGGNAAPNAVPGDLEMVETRCRLKASACRLFVQKRSADETSDEYAEILRRMNAMIDQAKSLPNCFLWAFWRERTPPDDQTLAMIADCYDALADAVNLMRLIDSADHSGRSEAQYDGLAFLAEAHSAIRVALEKTWLDSPDWDQQDVHIWLREQTRIRQVFIDRFMTLGDPANPENAGDLRVRIAQARQRLDDRNKRAKSISNALNRIKYHAGQLIRNGIEDAPAHWEKITLSIRDLMLWGITPTDRRIAEAIGPEAARLWSADDQNLRPVDGLNLPMVIDHALRLEAPEASDDDADRVGAGPHGWLQQQPSQQSADGRTWSEAVLEAREYLRGRRMVIVGGEPRPEAIARFIDAFALDAADWIELTEHGSNEPMRAPIYRPETALVVVIIKLAGHAQADFARKISAEAGKPCIFITGGYNPEPVAHEILKQASIRLARQVSATENESR